MIIHEEDIRLEPPFADTSTMQPRAILNKRKPSANCGNVLRVNFDRKQLQQAIQVIHILQSDRRSTTLLLCQFGYSTSCTNAVHAVTDDHRQNLKESKQSTSVVTTFRMVPRSRLRRRLCFTLPFQTVMLFIRSSSCTVTSII